MQKDGNLPVIPRMAGGEATPEGLLAVAEVARDYKLYTKITGAQRIGLFGAQKDDLPPSGASCWRRFETGQAYAAHCGMAKTCVGSTWRRFAGQRRPVELENRYKGICTLHKMKFGVPAVPAGMCRSPGHDVGIIATDAGWNSMAVTAA